MPPLNSAKNKVLRSIPPLRIPLAASHKIPKLKEQAPKSESLIEFRAVNGSKPRREQRRRAVYDGIGNGKISVTMKKPDHRELADMNHGRRDEIRYRCALNHRGKG